MVEPAGAVTAAALLKSPEAERGKTIVILISGSNIAPALLHAVANLSQFLKS